MSEEANLRAGFIRCGDCNKFAHLTGVSILRNLPNDYSGELCGDCSQWVCDVMYLPTKETVVDDLEKPSAICIAWVWMMEQIKA